MMTQEETPTNMDKGFRGGRYARTEEELYERAIALLEKCKIATRPSDQKAPKLETTTETSR